MALLIETGQMEAIPIGIGTPLKVLRSYEILKLDECAESAVQKNGGFADLMIELRRGLAKFVKCLTIDEVQSARVSPTKRTSPMR